MLLRRREEKNLPQDCPSSFPVSLSVHRKLCRHPLSSSTLWFGKICFFRFLAAEPPSNVHSLSQGRFVCLLVAEPPSNVHSLSQGRFVCLLVCLKSQQHTQPISRTVCLFAGCLTSQQHTQPISRTVCLLVACLTSQQHTQPISRTVCLLVACLTSQQHTQPVSRAVCLLVGCLTSQQHATVSQGRICSDNCSHCHTEVEIPLSPNHIHKLKPGPPGLVLTLQRQGPGKVANRVTDLRSPVKPDRRWAGPLVNRVICIT